MMKTISARSKNASCWKSKFASVLEVLLHACQVKIGEDRREEHVRPLPIDIVRRSGNHVRFLSFSPGRFFYRGDLWVNPTENPKHVYPSDNRFGHFSIRIVRNPVL